MRIVVATTAGDPFAGVFWRSYVEAGGVPPEYFFVYHPKSKTILRKAVEGGLLFGVRDAVKLFFFSKKGGEMSMSLPRLFPEAMFLSVCRLGRDPAFSFFREIAPDLMISVGASEIFSGKVLEVPSLGCVNVHNGRLPSYRGMFATFWEIYNGEKRGWVTIHRMTPVVDKGDIVAEAVVSLQGRGLFEVLLEKKRKGGRLLGELVRSLENKKEVLGGEATGAENNGREGYYSWPSFSEILRFWWGVRCSNQESNEGESR